MARNQGKGMSLDWKILLSEERNHVVDSERKKTFHEHYGSCDFRVHHEKDFDRVVFSSAVRRLQDKTQVFPLDQHDSVRTRLTHSIEVANLGRTLAAQFVDKLEVGVEKERAERSVPALVASIAMAHDIGNPPFGHQGEGAIQDWVKGISSSFGTLDERGEELLKDYLYFDGNPQGFRLLTQLSGVEHGGLNLTASTLRAFFKYPWASSSHRVDVEKPKFGFFQTEKQFFDWSGERVGLADEERHPLASLMEASDDIAYSVLDVEDGIKKELSSTAHLMVFLKNEAAGTAAAAWVRVLDEQYEADVQWLKKEGVEGRQCEDVLTQMLRSYLIALLVSVAVPSLKSAIEEGNSFEGNPCLEEPQAKALLKILKKYAKAFVYSHRSVERIELEGHRIIPYLLDVYWEALTRVEDKEGDKLDQYVYKSISPNYLRTYEATKSAGKFPLWYCKVQLVCDMVCGMTDSFALKQAGEFKSLGCRRD